MNDFQEAIQRLSRAQMLGDINEQAKIKSEIDLMMKKSVTFPVTSAIVYVMMGVMFGGIIYLCFR